MKFTGDIRGAEDMRAKLLALSKKFATQAVRKSLRAGAKVFAAELIQRAPVKTGTTKNAIRVRAGKRSRNKIRINVMIGAELFKGAVFHAAFVLLGKRTGKRGSKNRKVIPGTFWAHHAWSAKKEAAIETMKDSLAESLKEYEGK